MTNGSGTGVSPVRWLNDSHGRDAGATPVPGVWTFFTCTGLVRPSLVVTRAKGPAHTSLGQRPTSRPPRTIPSANGTARFPKLLSAGCTFQIMAANHSVEFQENTGCCPQGMGPNSTIVMPGIEMERAFSALASPVRLPSPLGWAGMMGAFGAPRFAGAVAMPQEANCFQVEVLSSASAPNPKFHGLDAQSD